MSVGRLRSLLKSLYIFPRYQILCRFCTTEFKSRYSIDRIYPNSKGDTLCVPSIKCTYTTTSDEPFSGFIPIEKIDCKFVRSGGPGGQNVNKVNTKVEMRFHVDNATWIPDWVKPRLKEKERGKINKDGVLIVSSEKTRVQMLNKADCLDKIRTMIYQASEKPKEPTEEEKRKIAADIARADGKRLDEKRKRSSIKRLRRKDLG